MHNTLPNTYAEAGPNLSVHIDRATGSIGRLLV